MYGTWTGSVREWYETLIEVLIDVSLTLQREMDLDEDTISKIRLEGDPDVVTIAMCSVLYMRRVDGLFLSISEERVLKGQHRVIFRHGETDEPLAIVHVLDIPPLEELETSCLGG